MRIEASTATVASAAASSPAWLPTAEKKLTVLADPIWADLLAPLGVAWLIIQIGFFLHEKLIAKPKRARKSKGEEQ